MQTIAVRPARQTASVFFRTSTSVSPWSARRSEWPTMTALAPASASISAEISPVWAPDGLGWQSWPPSVTPFEPDNLAAKAAINVVGGQTSRSAFPVTLEAPGTMALNSAIDARRPFIFQLPAMSGRMVELISKRFLQKALLPQSLAEVNKIGQIGPNQRPA